MKPKNKALNIVSVYEENKKLPGESNLLKKTGSYRDLSELQIVYLILYDFRGEKCIDAFKVLNRLNLILNTLSPELQCDNYQKLQQINSEFFKELQKMNLIKIDRTTGFNVMEVRNIEEINSLDFRVSIWKKQENFCQVLHELTMPKAVVETYSVKGRDKGEDIVKKRKNADEESNVPQKKNQFFYGSVSSSHKVSPEVSTTVSKPFSAVTVPGILRSSFVTNSKTTDPLGEFMKKYEEKYNSLQKPTSSSSNVLDNLTKKTGYTHTL